VEGEVKVIESHVATPPSGDGEPIRKDPAGRYSRIAELIAADECVILDGAIGTELLDVSGVRPEVEENLWGLTHIIDDPARVRAVHRHYVEAGCDVVSTDTWGLPTAVREGAPQLVGGSSRPVHWMDVARQGIRLVRQAADEAGRADHVAAAFSVNGDLDTPDSAEMVRLLSRTFEDESPDLVLLETLTLVGSSTYATVEALLATGLPVWLSFRRCRHGVCGVYGEHWGGPEGDAFGRAARRFEEMGVGALLVNCIPPDHVAGMVSWLRDFTDLPLGVYPNLGYLSAGGWRSETAVGGSEYAELARRWRDEGAQIIGGCCGVGPEHIAATRSAVANTKAGHARPAEVLIDERSSGAAGPARTLEPWTDARGTRLWPLQFPDIFIEPSVFVPTQGSFLAWKFLSREAVGAHQRCLDVGSGSGLLAIQLALNGAAHVHAIDIEQAAVSNTLTNAFRNGVSDRVTAEAVDLFPWVPEEQYDVIVASLYQLPVDPFEQVATHRPLDFWGRNLLDHLIALLPDALADDGVAYILQLSIIGQQRTVEQLDALGFESRVVDFSFFEFHELFQRKSDQIARVEELSDAYHLKLGDRDVIVAYLIEVKRRSAAQA
jgi:S-methylmethionine-dependent homocysteine/selenocysteine methylase/SAM-dependent methyltransferase